MIRTNNKVCANGFRLCAHSVGQAHEILYKAQMLNALDTQFQLAEDGQILFQSSVNNPLPGEPVARLEKGEDILAPKITLGEKLFASSSDMCANAQMITKSPFCTRRAAAPLTKMSPLPRFSASMV